MTEIEGRHNRKCRSSNAECLLYNQAVLSEVGRRICPGSASPIASNRRTKRSFSSSGGTEWERETPRDHAAAPRRSLQSTRTSNQFAARLRTAAIVPPADAVASSTRPRIVGDDDAIPPWSAGV